jgi:hypothetical protein
MDQELTQHDLAWSDRPKRLPAKQTESAFPLEAHPGCWSLRGDLSRGQRRQGGSGMPAPRRRGCRQTSSLLRPQVCRDQGRHWRFQHHLLRAPINSVATWFPADRVAIWLQTGIRLRGNAPKLHFAASSCRPHPRITPGPEYQPAISWAKAGFETGRALGLTRVQRAEVKKASVWNKPAESRREIKSAMRC